MFIRLIPISLIYIVLSVFFSCSADPKYTNLETKYATEEKIDIEFEEVNIQIDTLTFPSYSIFQNAFFNDSSYLVGFNKKTNSLDIFSLTSRKFHRHVKIAQKGPNGIFDIRGFYMHSWDSIFIFSYNKLVIIDSSSIVKSSFDLFDLGIQSSEGTATVSVNLGFDLHYSKLRNSIFFKYIPRDVPFESKEFYEKPFVAEFSLDSLILSIVPFKQSQYIKDNYLAKMDRQFISFHDNHLFCCFTGESNIYSYDLETGKNNVYGGRSEFTKQCATPLSRNASREQINKHKLESVAFLNLRYDHYRGLYYRIHFGDIEYRISDEINATFLDKGLYLMIFNKNLELIKELELEKYVFLPEFYGFSEEGIFLNANHPMNMDYEGEYAKFKLLKLNYDK